MANPDKELEKAQRAFDRASASLDATEAKREVFDARQASIDKGIVPEAQTNQAIENFVDRKLYDIDVQFNRREEDKRRADPKNGIDTSKTYRRGGKTYFNEETGALKTDSDTKLFFKDLWNETIGKAGRDFQIDAFVGGQKVATGNKDLYDKSTVEQLRKELETKEDNPDAKHVFYIKKIYDGKDENGNDKFVYKNGVDKSGLFNRTKGQILNEGGEIVFEKRFVGAEDYEHRLQMAVTREGLNTYSLGKRKKGGSLEPSGYTEIIDRDVLGKDSETTDYFANLQKSKQRQKDWRVNHRGDDGIEDAIAYGAVTLGNDLADVALTGIGALGNAVGLDNTLRDNIFDTWSDDAARITGYDQASARTAMVEVSGAFKRGDYFTGILGNAGGLTNAIGESVPEMGLMFIGLPAGAVVKGLETATKLEKLQTSLALVKTQANKASAVTGDAFRVRKLQKEINAVKEEMNVLGIGGKTVAELQQRTALTTAKELGGQLGLNATVAKQANEIIEDRRANGDEDISMGEVVGITASTYLLSMMDKFSVSKILGDPTKLALARRAAEAVTEKSGEAVKNGLIVGLANLTKKATKGLPTAIVGESVQEYLQTWGEILGKQLGVVDNGESVVEQMQKILTDDKNREEALQAGIVGGFGGGLFHGLGVGGSAVGSMFKTVTGANKNTKENPFITRETLFDSSVTEDLHTNITNHFNPESDFEIRGLSTDFDLVDDVASKSPEHLISVTMSLLQGNNMTDPDKVNIVRYAVSKMDSETLEAHSTNAVINYITLVDAIIDSAKDTETTTQGSTPDTDTTTDTEAVKNISLNPKQLETLRTIKEGIETELEFAKNESVKDDLKIILSLIEDAEGGKLGKGKDRFEVNSHITTSGFVDTNGRLRPSLRMYRRAIDRATTVSLQGQGTSIDGLINFAKSRKKVGEGNSYDRALADIIQQENVDMEDVLSKAHTKLGKLGGTQSANKKLLIESTIHEIDSKSVGFVNTILNDNSTGKPIQRNKNLNMDGMLSAIIRAKTLGSLDGIHRALGTLNSEEVHFAKALLMKRNHLLGNSINLSDDVYDTILSQTTNSARQLSRSQLMTMFAKVYLTRKSTDKRDRLISHLKDMIAHPDKSRTYSIDEVTQGIVNTATDKSQLQDVINTVLGGIAINPKDLDTMYASLNKTFDTSLSPEIVESKIEPTPDKSTPDTAEVLPTTSPSERLGNQENVNTTVDDDTSAIDRQVQSIEFLERSIEAEKALSLDGSSTSTAKAIRARLVLEVEKVKGKVLELKSKLDRTKDLIKKIETKHSKNDDSIFKTNGFIQFAKTVKSIGKDNGKGSSFKLTKARFLETFNAVSTVADENYFNNAYSDVELELAVAYAGGHFKEVLQRPNGRYKEAIAIMDYFRTNNNQHLQSKMNKIISIHSNPDENTKLENEFLTKYEDDVAEVISLNITTRKSIVDKLSQVKPLTRGRVSTLLHKLRQIIGTILQKIKKLNKERGQYEIMIDYLTEFIKSEEKAPSKTNINKDVLSKGRELFKEDKQEVIDKIKAVDTKELKRQIKQERGVVTNDGSRDTSSARSSIENKLNELKARVTDSVKKKREYLKGQRIKLSTALAKLDAIKNSNVDKQRDKIKRKRELLAQIHAKENARDDMDGRTREAKGFDRDIKELVDEMASIDIVFPLEDNKIEAEFLKDYNELTTFTEKANAKIDNAEGSIARNQGTADRLTNEIASTVGDEKLTTAPTESTRSIKSVVKEVTEPSTTSTDIVENVGSVFGSKLSRLSQIFTNNVFEVSENGQNIVNAVTFSQSKFKNNIAIQAEDGKTTFREDIKTFQNEDVGIINPLTHPDFKKILESENFNEIINTVSMAYAVLGNKLASDLVTNTDKVKLASNLSISIDEVNDLIFMAKNGKVPFATLRTDIAPMLLDMLGVQFNADMPLETVDIMTNALLNIVEANIDTNTKGKREKFHSNAIKGKEYIMFNTREILPDNKDDRSKLLEDFDEILYLSEDYGRQRISNKPFEYDVDTNIVHSKTKVSKENQDLLNKNGSTPWKFDGILEEMSEKYLSSTGRDEVLSAFGFITVDYLNDDIDAINLAESTNEKVEREVASLFNNYLQTQKDEFYVPWAITKSDRATIRSEINSQESKVHREFTSTDGMRSEVKPTHKNKREVSDITYDKMTPEEMFEIALSQAFDLDPDKKSNYGVFKEIRQKIDIYGAGVRIIGTDTQSKNLNLFINSKDINYEILKEAYSIGGMHTVKAYLELKKLNQTKRSGKFDGIITSLTFESDAITSGAMLQFMQVKTKHSLQLLEKGGIYTDEARARWSEYTKHLLAKKHHISEDDVQFTAGALIEAGKYHLSLNKSTDRMASIEIKGKVHEPFLDLYTEVGVKTGSNVEEQVRAIEPTKSGGTSLGHHMLELFKKSIFDEDGNLDLGKLRKTVKPSTIVKNYDASKNTSNGGLMNATVYKAIREDLNRGDIDSFIKFKLIEIIKSAKVGFDIFPNSPKGKGLKLTKEHILELNVDISSKTYEEIVQGGIGLALRNGIIENVFNNSSNYVLYDRNKVGERLKMSDPDVKEAISKTLIAGLSPNASKGTKLQFIKLMKKFNLDTADTKKALRDANGAANTALQDAFDDVFGENDAVLTSIKNIDYIVSKVFNMKFQDAVKKIKETRAVTTKDVEDITNRLVSEGFGHGIEVDGNTQPLFKVDTTNENSTNRSALTYAKAPKLEAVNGKLVDSTTVSINTKGMKFIDNTGASSTIPIHKLDAKAIRTALIDDDYLSIYDAVVQGLDHEGLQSVNEKYNSGVVADSATDNIMISYATKLNNMLKLLSPEEYSNIQQELATVKFIPANTNRVVESMINITSRADQNSFETHDNSNRPSQTPTVVTKTKHSVLLEDLSGKKAVPTLLVEYHPNDKLITVETFNNGKHYRKNYNNVTPEMFGGDIDFTTKRTDELMKSIQFVLNSDDVKKGNKSAEIVTNSKGIKTPELNEQSSIDNFSDSKMTTFDSDNITSIPSKMRKALSILREGEEEFSNIKQLHVNHIFITGTPMTTVPIDKTNINPLKYDEQRVANMLDLYDSMAMVAANEVLKRVRELPNAENAKMLMTTDGNIVLTGTETVTFPDAVDDILNKYSINTTAKATLVNGHKPLEFLDGIKLPEVVIPSEKVVVKDEALEIKSKDILGMKPEHIEIIKSYNKDKNKGCKS